MHPPPKKQNKLDNIFDIILQYVVNFKQSPKQALIRKQIHISL